ncbi:MAG: iron(III) transport system substrate-binding protein [Phycisphaerales bacterium]|jgi:iron(III) transport system substrate-binding protein
MLTRIILAIALAVILGVPFALSLGSGGTHNIPDDAPRIIIVTPHVQQIQEEYATGFNAWHIRQFGGPIAIDYRSPGGTSDIIKQLKAQFFAALNDGLYAVEQADDGGVQINMEPGAVSFDLFFGGGSYDHSQTAKGVSFSLPADRSPSGEKADVLVSMSASAGFSQARIDEWYGENLIGSQRIYDEDQLWLGTALSSFGIVYNTDVYEEKLGLPLPTGFEDLTMPELRGWVALADPRQSGSITTTFDSILGNHGWTDGWAILRAMCGNTRYFTASSTKPPTDVSQGDAAAGLAIDFYGRGQAQTAGRGRVGYVEPAGAVYVDADPVTLLNGAPNPELAKRFIEYCLTEEAQALWQFHSVATEEGAGNPVNPATGEPMGPVHYELRRMPVRRVMYEKYWSSLMDQVNPFEIASQVKNPGWRTGVQVMMGCFAIDSADECRRAWDALCDAEADPDFSPEVAERMREMFFAWPETPVDAAGGFDADSPVKRVPWTEETYGEVRDSWRPPGAQSRAEIYYTIWFRAQYRQIETMRTTGAILAPAGAGS